MITERSKGSLYTARLPFLAFKAIQSILMLRCIVDLAYPLQRRAYSGLRVLQKVDRQADLGSLSADCALQWSG